MPLKSYGVLKGRVIDRQLGAGQNAHYQVHLIDDTTDFRIAINVNSKLSPSELEYLIDSRFEHPFLEQLTLLPLGWNVLPRKPGGPALDFIRTNLFDPRDMVPLPFNVPGPDNDLNEKLDHFVQRAMADEEAIAYAFGERWGPENQKKDKIFGFLPGNGVHNIHMNQANVGQFVKHLFAPASAKRFGFLIKGCRLIENTVLVPRWSGKLYYASSDTSITSTSLRLEPFPKLLQEWTLTLEQLCSCLRKFEPLSSVNLRELLLYSRSRRPLHGEEITLH